MRRDNSVWSFIGDSTLETAGVEPCLSRKRSIMLFTPAMIRSDRARFAHGNTCIDAIVVSISVLNLFSGIEGAGRLEGLCGSGDALPTR